MKKIFKLYVAIVLVLIITLAFPLNVSAAPIEDDQTIFGESYTLESGEILDGDLKVIGGVVEIEEGAIITGKVLVLGGLANIDGLIEGDLTVLGGTVTLEETAVIQGDLITSASYVNRSAGAVIEGVQRRGWDIPWTNSDVPFIIQPRNMRSPNIRVVPLVTRISSQSATILVLVSLGALMLLIMPNASDHMTRALKLRPLSIIIFGIFTAQVIIIGGLFLTLTIIFIPVVILVGLMVSLALLAGWLALGYALGKRIASNIFKAKWHPVLAGALGNLFLYLIAKVLALIPCIGSFFLFIAVMMALGMAVVTLFGSIPYPRDLVPQEERVVLYEVKDAVNADVIVVEKTRKEGELTEGTDELEDNEWREEIDS